MTTSEHFLPGIPVYLWRGAFLASNLRVREGMIPGIEYFDYFWRFSETGWDHPLAPRTHPIFGIKSAWRSRQHTSAPGLMNRPLICLDLNCPLDPFLDPGVLL